MSTDFYRVAGEALILNVWVQPGAKQDAVMGVAGGALRIRLRAPAIEGRANDALCAYLAELFGTAKSRVEVLKGVSGRRKQVVVRGARHPVETLFSPEKTAARSKKTRFSPENT
ncbi:MAG TPA: DUF167 domain-containing protein [Gammaproteobacteria bacterium]|nr:DUF167 domain-containing protein [Gammaproteobacteria bacterium]